MHDVFISYSSKEMETAETVRDILEKNRISCWMAPRDIPSGSNYTKQIPVAIRACQVFVLILSEKAQSSPWVLRELDMAVNCGKVIIPFMLEEFCLNDEFNFLLTGKQRYEAYKKKTEVMQTLISRIHAIIGGKQPVVEEKTEENQEEVKGSVQSAQKKQGEKKQEIPIVESFLGRICCPACGSDQVRQTKKIGTIMSYNACGGIELKLGWFTMTFTVIACYIGLLSGASNSNKSGIGPLAMMLLSGGITWLVCRFITRQIVIRQRPRHKIYPYAMQCEKCRKMFLQKEE